MRGQAGEEGKEKEAGAGAKMEGGKQFFGLLKSRYSTAN